MDDDVLVQKDMGEVLKKVVSNLDKSTALTCPCNIWDWNDECHHFDFHSQEYNIRQTAVLYHDKPTCKSHTKDTQADCTPSNWEQFINDATPFGKNAESQTAWNFGFCLIHNKNWRENKITRKYEQSMKKNYELHEIPETSLAFGLGLPFLSLTGHVACWDEAYMKVRDGFGFIEWERYKKTFGNDFFSQIDVAHYTGPKKPWVDFTSIDSEAVSPWLEMMAHENLTIPQQLSKNQTKPLFQVLTSWRSGSEWVTLLLDQHPHICAAGETRKPEVGFPTEAMSV